MRTILLLLFPFYLFGQVDTAEIYRRADAQFAKYQKMDSIGSTNFPFRFTDVRSYINSADGVMVSVLCRYYKKEKDIKYLYITMVPYNQVGDPQSCYILRRSEFTGKITGPISAQYHDFIWQWDAAWYNNTIRCIQITKVVVQYMDGTSYTYIKDLPKIMGDYHNDCSYR